MNYFILTIMLVLFIILSLWLEALRWNYKPAYVLGDDFDVNENWLSGKYYTKEFGTIDLNFQMQYLYIEKFHDENHLTLEGPVAENAIKRINEIRWSNNYTNQEAIEIYLKEVA